MTPLNPALFNSTMTYAEIAKLTNSTLSQVKYYARKNKLQVKHKSERKPVKIEKNFNPSVNTAFFSNPFNIASEKLATKKTYAQIFEGVLAGLQKTEETNKGYIAETVRALSDEVLLNLINQQKRSRTKATKFFTAYQEKLEELIKEKAKSIAHKIYEKQ